MAPPPPPPAPPDMPGKFILRRVLLTLGQLRRDIQVLAAAASVELPSLGKILPAVQEYSKVGGGVFEIMLRGHCNDLSKVIPLLKRIFVKFI